MKSSIWVSDSVELAYIDTGAPLVPVYTTIFAIHGMVFGGSVFSRLAERMFAENVRFVSIVRRGYRGSSPYTKSEIAAVTNGTEEERATFKLEQSHQLVRFITTFIKRFSLPSISANDSAGGVAVLGWSMGTIFALSLIAYMPSLSTSDQVLFREYLRSLILLDPATTTLGLPPASKAWAPFVDPIIPPEETAAMFTPWVSSYFDHKNIEGRGFDGLTYVAPSLNRHPTIYNMTSVERDSIIETEAAGFDGAFASKIQSQILSDLRTSLFDPVIRGLLPHMRVTHILGTSSTASCVAAWWGVEAEDERYGGGYVNFELVTGANHLMHWDEPEQTSRVILAEIKKRAANASLPN